MNCLFVPGSNTSPSSRFRQWQFVEPLGEAGLEITTRVISPPRDYSPAGIAGTYVGRRSLSLWRLLSGYRIARAAGKFDCVFAHKDIVPEFNAGFLDRLMCDRAAYSVFDFDDAIHLGRRGEKLGKVLPRFSAVVAGNEYLAEFANQHSSNVHIWPTVVDTDHYKVRGSRRPGMVRIGWSGSHYTIKQCLPMLRDAMEALAREREFEFVVIANKNPHLDWKLNSRFVLWTPETEVEEIQQIDVGLMPLHDSEFERGKCGLKAIQYMAVGTPALVSPVGVNRDIVEHGVSGFHCSSDSDWIDGAITLIDDAALREKMGAAAAETVRKSYSVRSLLPRMKALLTQQ